MFQKLKQYKDLRDQSKKMKSTLEKETVHADAAGGKIGVVMDGNQQILSIDIDESLFAPQHKQTVEKGIKEAIEGAMKKLQRLMIEKMKSGEIQLPDLTKLS
jgi:DNA-binding YbaB/EbfC family protein